MFCLINHISANINILKLEKKINSYQNNLSRNENVNRKATVELPRKMGHDERFEEINQFFQCNPPIKFNIFKLK
jgi:hypothetical protein